MAATKYQVLYRYTNPNSNQLLTNDSESKYESVLELYHDKHKLAVGTADEKLEANDEKSELIIDGNNTANDNYNMLFKFTGTKRINKREWVPVTTGYVIRDKEAVRNKVTRAVDGDYSGEYLLVEGDTIENGIVVAKKNPITSIIQIKAEKHAANESYFVDKEELQNAIKNATIAQLVSSDLQDYGTLQAWKDYYGNNTGYHNITIRVTNFTLSDITYRSGYTAQTTVHNALRESMYTSIVNSGGLAFSEVRISPSQVETYQIPAHYEESADYPYAICDTYERVEQSPWFILSTHASLQSAIDKVKAVVKSVGIENVKLIKVVPTDQFIKIQ